MIGGSKGHPGGKMIRAEAVPAVKTMTSSKMPVNTSLFIFLPPLLFLPQRVVTLFFSLCANMFLDVLIKLFIHDSFRLPGI